jgi:hypothetical protein
MRKVMKVQVFLFISLLAVVLIRVLSWIGEVNAARKLGEIVHVPYSREMYMMAWNAVPYLFMSGVLLREGRLLKSGSIATVNTMPVAIASVSGIAFYFYTDIVNNDGFGFCKHLRDVVAEMD